MSKLLSSDRLTVHADAQFEVSYQGMTYRIVKAAERNKWGAVRAMEHAVGVKQWECTTCDRAFSTFTLALPCVATCMSFDFDSILVLMLERYDMLSVNV